MQKIMLPKNKNMILATTANQKEGIEIKKNTLMSQKIFVWYSCSKQNYKTLKS